MDSIRNAGLLPGTARSLRTVDAVMLLAVVAPTLIAINLPPSSTFFNQAAALLGWGLLVICLALYGHAKLQVSGRMWLILGPLAVVAAAAAVSVVLNGLPSSLALSAIGNVSAAIIVVLAGAAARRSPAATDVFRGLCIALVVAGLLGALIGSIQLFVPDWTDGEWLASAPADNRASSNLRQPNHLSSLLVWSLIALAWLWESRTVRVALAVPLGVFFVFGIVLTGSRTGLLDFGLLTLWALIDRRMPRPVRVALCGTLPLYILFWFGMAQWAHATHAVFGGEARMQAQGDISSSRYAIWRNTWSLIQAHPWLGVGWGEFNFAWSLTPFPNRPVAFFDHTHNVFLQFAVELGLPLAIALTATLLAALALVFLGSLKTDARRASMLQAAFLLLVTIGVHSMLEYPLWYAYFLLPAAFCFGFGLGQDPDPGAGFGADDTPAASSRRLAVLGAALAIGAVGALADYHRVTVIFTADESLPLAQRIERGQASVFFSYQADYAAATTAAHPSQQMEAFRGATQNLLDTRLMIAWATAYAERGDLERARHIAERLREFRNEDSKEFFASCANPQGELPFQCGKPQRAMDYRDFRR